MIDVLYSDNHVLAVAKPAGLPTVPDESGDASLFDHAKAWVKHEFAKPGKAFLGVVHRLDRPVSGVVVFARTSKAAARLSGQFRARAASKLYLAIGEGKTAKDRGTLEQRLVKDEAANRVRVARGDDEGAAPARTRWRVLESIGGERGTLTLFELVPETGRAHQLRVAAATLGSPLLGDLKYGASAPLPDASIALHARRLEIEHPTRRDALVLECPLPDRAWWRGWRTLA